MTRRLKLILLAAVFIGGFASLSLELIVLRQLSSFVGATAVTASIVIGVIMAFMSLGYCRFGFLPGTRSCSADGGCFFLFSKHSDCSGCQLYSD